MHEVTPEVLTRTTSRALGEELRLAREARGWSRGELVARLPSGIGERTLLSYEHGTRQVTVPRLVEICAPVDVSPGDLLTRAIQRGQISLANLELLVDLRELLADSTPAFRPMHQWATNKLNECTDGIAKVPPAAVRELAAFAGYTPEELTHYLTKFTPLDWH